MNNAGKVEAYKSYYAQAKELYLAGDIVGARDLFLKAAEVANDISVMSDSFSVKTEYYNLAMKILSFVKTECVVKKPPVPTTGEAQNKNSGEKNQEETRTFAPESRKNQITFEDVAGLDEVKDDIRFKVLAPMQNQELAKKYKVDAGAKILLYGPPGTGKTYIARAIAGEVDAAFYSVNCQDLISKYMGESSQQLDKLFEEAQKNERAIIFFDEFDSVASKRGDGTSGADAEMARFVATFLTKVDGFKKSETCKMLLLIAATNRPWALDSAMLRGGRFDTHIYIGLPDKEARAFMVSKELRGVPVAEDVNSEKLADAFEGFGGGDIVSACKKINAKAFRRSILTGKVVDISKEDCNEVLQSLKQNISQEELAKFEFYRTYGFVE